LTNFWARLCLPPAPDRLTEIPRLLLRFSPLSLTPHTHPPPHPPRPHAFRFADLTDEEFQFFLGVDANIEPAKLESFSGARLNATSGAYNLYDSGLVTPVKDQQQCGSCWAFSATETIESAWVKAGNSLTEFSPQQIVSCDSADAGCNGGLPTQAFDYVKGAGGMATDAAYPYTSGKGVTGTCQDGFSTVGGTVSAWEYTQPAAGRFSSGNTEDSDAMASALQQFGGISIAIDASSWNSYTGGVMTSASCSSKPSKMDHAVQVVGYDMDAADGPYWIVRNSWNTVWGEKGFIRLKAGENTCGIANLAAYVSKI
jgi:C1A family cysteine protease